MPIQGLEVSRFLCDYWQTKPLFIQQGLPDFVCPVTGDDLAGLACEDAVESRLILQNGDDWQLRQGPFDEQTFSELTSRGWTLLVQRVDHWIAEVADLIAEFDFLPRWRIDDVMISYAAAGGGVGPHYDNYDVFLLQGSGRRDWRLGQHCNEATPLRKSLDLKQLSEFQESSRYILEAGDILYVPPGTAHWGTALDDDCITLSIGFRAPSSAEILSRWTDEVIDQLNESDRYRDPVSTLAQGNTLSTEHLRYLRELLQAKLDDGSLIKGFGELVTEPADDLKGQANAECIEDCDEACRALDARLTLYHDDQACILFANGCSLSCDAESLAMLRIICDLLPGELLPNELWFTVREHYPAIASFLLSTGAMYGDSYGLES
ncbi:MAG: 50S ribosomal protein L16 3-hydroxylase [Bermanella sp.]|jgi:50S ribosomal protein L16 3-hydroxylase